MTTSKEIKKVLDNKVVVNGYLQEKNDMWYVRLVWYERRYGKKVRKQKWIRTELQVYGNKRRAQELLKQFAHEKEEELQSCIVVINRDLIVSEFMMIWLESRRDDKRHPIRQNTFEGYERKVKKYIVPYFDRNGMRLVDLEASDIDEFYDYLFDQGLSVNSVREIHSNIHYALKWAKRKGYVNRNVADDVDTLPSDMAQKGDYYTTKELKRLFEICKDDPLEAVIKLTAYYGLRRSEVLGLQWSAIDFDAKVIRIRRTAVMTNQGTKFQEKTKSKASMRSMTIPDDMLCFLRTLRDKQLEEKELFGDGYFDNNLVGCWADGSPLSPYYVTEHFSALLEKNGLRHIRFHDLRHSAATLLLSNGFGLKDVQEYLGHSTITVTANFYGHLDSERTIATSEKVNSCLGAAL